VHRAHGWQDCPLEGTRDEGRQVDFTLRVVYFHFSTARVCTEQPSSRSRGRKRNASIRGVPGTDQVRQKGSFDPLVPQGQPACMVARPCLWLAVRFGHCGCVTKHPQTWRPETATLLSWIYSSESDGLSLLHDGWDLSRKHLRAGVKVG
jgi:hypothetical protein